MRGARTLQYFGPKDMSCIALGEDLANTVLFHALPERGGGLNYFFTIYIHKCLYSYMYI